MQNKTQSKRMKNRGVVKRHKDVGSSFDTLVIGILEGRRELKQRYLNRKWFRTF